MFNSLSGRNQFEILNWRCHQRNRCTRNEFVIGFEKSTVLKRLQDYFNPAISDSQIARSYPRAMKQTARFDPREVRGHLLKSRSRALTVEGSLFDPVGGCACCIDYPNGGTLNVKGNVILHYGATANSDENPPIKFGSEQQQTEMTVTLIGAISVGQVITGPAPENASGTVTGVYSAGTRIVYSKTQDGRYFQIGDEVRVGGVLRATINSKSGSPDGLSDDGRVHAINVSQNTFRKDQPTHPSFDDIALMWVYRMTTADGTDVPQAATTGAATVRNNILAGDVIGSATSATNAAWANNSSVARSTVSDLGVYSGGRIAGDPIVGDAPWTWAGEFTQPKARSDTFRGGL